MTTEIFRLPEVLERCKLTRSTLYAMMERGEFPRPIKLGERVNAWTSRQLEAWIAEREAAAADV
jgi:prophage regulatory protein